MRISRRSDQVRTRRLFWLAAAVAALAGLSAGALTKRQSRRREVWDARAIAYGQKAVGFALQETTNRSLAAKHESEANNANNYVKSWKAMGGRMPNVPEPMLEVYEQDYRRQKRRKTRASAEAERYRERAAYAARMREKYEYAASHPWEPVEPDPPPP
jgi:hypothetical protein